MKRFDLEKSGNGETVFTIRNTGDAIQCKGLDETVNKLYLNCRGSSVAVHYTGDSGIRKFICVDVPRDMSEPIMHSYSDRAFDCSSLY